MSAKMKSWFMRLSASEREEVAKAAGTSVPYLLKRMYTAPADRLPVFKTRIAVGLDRASGGSLDFRDMIGGGREIDWEYVCRKLGQK